MLLDDILRDTEARIKELQPVVDEHAELKSVAEAFRKIGIKPSARKATMAVIELDTPEPKVEGEDEPVLVNSGASVPIPEQHKQFNSHRKRGMIEQNPGELLGLYYLVTFQRKDDTSTYRVVKEHVPEKSARDWIEGKKDLKDIKSKNNSNRGSKS